MRIARQGEEFAAVARGAGRAAHQRVRIAGTPQRRNSSRDIPVKDVQDKAGYLHPRHGLERSSRSNAVARGHAAKHRGAIVELSKAMYVMTPFTSLLVLENEDMYTRLRSTAATKDHWAFYSAPQRIKVVFRAHRGRRGRSQKGLQAICQDDRPDDSDAANTAGAGRGPFLSGEAQYSLVPAGQWERENTKRWAEEMNQKELAIVLSPSNVRSRSIRWLIW